MGHARFWPVTELGILNARRVALDLPPLDDDAIDDAWAPAELAEHSRGLTDPTWRGQTG